MPYFDNAATTYPKPETVYTAMDQFMRSSGGNPGRGTHRAALEAYEAVEHTCELLARLFNVADPDRVVFAGNTTDAINMALHGCLQPGDHVVTSSMEHNAVMRPLRTLEERRIRVTRVPCAPDGSLDPQRLFAAMESSTRLVALTHASNVTGTIMPVADVGAGVRARGALFLVDAAQTAGVLPIDVRAMNIDLLAFPGHKGLLGPMGTGGLAVGERVRLHPTRQGGTGTRSEEEQQPAGLPQGFEVGTLNAVGIVGLGAGVRFILEEGPERIRRHEAQLLERLLAALTGTPGLTVYGPCDAERQVAVVSIRLAHWEPVDLGVALDQEYDIAVRTGLHCAPAAHRTIGTLPTGTTRLAPGCFTRPEEVDLLASAIRTLAVRWQAVPA